MSIMLLHGKLSDVPGLEKNDYVQAKEALENALRFEPENWSILRNLGVLSILKRDYKKARELLESALSKNRNDYKSLYALVYVCVNLKDYETAERLINNVFVLRIPDEIRNDLENLLVKIQSKYLY